ncbi:MAG: hypothetical protein A3A51_04520 [Candidatus Levybacteria bacterium RIFCSPLOWO2_01_FULL_39_10]|nr:MAG: hypothetical protein A3A51_04520 [Candidatus Levybacteria bacterium RIFCSPLOWO2_01_FULL_39_10]
MKRNAFIFFIALVFLFGYTVVQISQYSSDKLTIVFCDVGQGDAIFIRTPAKTDILIDGGPDKSVLDCLSHNMPFWDKTIDLIVLTHPHADHMTGLVSVIERYKVLSFYDSNERPNDEIYALLMQKLADKNLSARKLARGNNFKDSSGMRFRIFWPRLKSSDEVKQNISNNDLNSLSSVGILKFGNFSVLFTGDAESEILKNFAAEIGDVNILKVPHQGSSGALTDEILEIIKPELAVILVGENNRYGHPSRDTVELLKKHKVKVLRTDIDGEIKVASNGKTYWTY